LPALPYEPGLLNTNLLKLLMLYSHSRSCSGSSSTVNLACSTSTLEPGLLNLLNLACSTSTVDPALPQQLNRLNLLLLYLSTDTWPDQPDQQLRPACFTRPVEPVLLSLLDLLSLNN
jgi:hypothetical protein